MHDDHLASHLRYRHTAVVRHGTGYHYPEGTLMTDQEWQIIVSIIGRIPGGEADCDGMAECLLEDLAQALGR